MPVNQPTVSNSSKLVIQRAGRQLIVEDENGVTTSVDLPKKFKYHQSVTGGVLVGDRVYLDENSSDNNKKTSSGSRIARVEERNNAFFRGDPFSPELPQGIAANLDRVVVMASLVEPQVSFGFVDRLLVACECSGIPEIILVWNKLDLLNEDFENSTFAMLYRQIGYRVIGISVHANELGQLPDVINNGRSLLIGGSGVGKSSLLNQLLPEADIATNPISESTGKGVHTTTVAKLHRLPSGGEIIDTPGFKAFTLIGVTDQFELFFPEFNTYLGTCRFTDCSHLGDAGCAISKAVEDGEIAQERYRSFQSMKTEIRFGR